jgi:hypothetical protein
LLLIEHLPQRITFPYRLVFIPGEFVNPFLHPSLRAFYFFRLTITFYLFPFCLIFRF